MSNRVLRKDPVTGHWVLFAEVASVTPELSWPPIPRTLDVGDDLESVVPWVTTAPAALDRAARVERSRSEDGLFTSMSGAGEHRVLLDAPRSGLSFVELDEATAADVVEGWRDQMRELEQDNRFRQLVLVKSAGWLAGAQTSQPHTEVFGLSFVPESVRAKLVGLNGHHRRMGRCTYCDLIRAERNEKVRLVKESFRHAALSPYAAQHPFELLILPKGHHSNFLKSDREAIEDLAKILQDSIARLASVLDTKDFTMVLHTAPVDAGADAGQFHFHVELRPHGVWPRKLGDVIPFNPVLPEAAAEALRAGAGKGVLP